MRQLVTSAALVASLCLVASCGDKKTNNNNDNTICTPNITVDCGDVPAAQVNNQTFVKGLATATCAADGKSWDTSKCTLIAQGTLQEGDICDPTGSECSTGLDCVTVTAGLDDQGNDVTAGVCFASCSATTACTNSEQCFPVWSALSPVCSQPNQLRDTVCGYGGACEPTLTCLSTVNFGQECKQLCDPGTVGTAGVCTNGEKCLNTDAIALQLTADFKPISCTSGNNTPCDTAHGYACIDPGTGNGGLCVTNPPACGTEIVPTTANFAADFDSAHACDLPGVSQFCGALPAADATIKPECVQQGGGVFVETKSGAAVSCTDSTKCAFANGFDCLQLSGSGGGTVQECAVPANYCVAFCEDTDGVSTGSCGTGYTCAAPADYINVSSFVIQPPDSGDNVHPAKPCTVDTNCDQADGFACTTFADGQFCIRPRKVCTST